MSQSFAEELSGVEKSHNLAVSLERAFDYARDGGQPTVMLEHLLLALSEDSEAVSVLSACNIDLDRLRTDVAGHLGRMGGHGDGVQPVGEPLADPTLVTIIRHASAAAQKSGRAQLNGAIVLAAIIGDGKSNAAQILEGQGLTFQGTLQALQSQGKPQTANPQIAAPQATSPQNTQSQSAPSNPVAPERPAQTISTPHSAQSGPAAPSAPDQPQAQGEDAPASVMDDAPSVDDILGSARKRVHTKGAVQGAASTQEQEQEPDGFPKILQNRAGTAAQPSDAGAQPERGGIGEGMPKIVSERMNKKTADKADRNERVDAPAPAPAMEQTQAPAQMPQPSQRQPAPQPAQPRPAQPVAPTVQTDKWARAIDGKPSVSTASPVPQQPVPSQQIPPQPAAPQPPQPDAVLPVQPEQSAPAAPNIGNSGAVAAPAPSYSGSYPQGDGISGPGSDSAPLRTQVITPAPARSNAADQERAPAPAPAPSPAPAPAPQFDINNAQAAGPPIEPWPEPRDLQKQPPPGTPPGSQNGGLAGLAPGSDVNTNPAGAPYPSTDDLSAPRAPPARYSAQAQAQMRAQRGRPGGVQQRGVPQASGGVQTRERKSGTQVSLGQLIENIPRIMRVAIPATVEVRIARDKVEALSEGMQGHAPVQRHDLFITKAMTVKLRAPDGGFWIETASPETQWIENTLGLLHDEFASWRWTVTPRESGAKRLQLVVSARTVGTDGLAAETPLPDQVITVKVRINFGQVFKKFGGWVIAALVGGAISAFGGTLAGTGGLRSLLALIGL